VLAKGNPDSELIANMKLIDLMKAMPGTGDIKALKILKSLSISSRKTVRGLSKKQFESLEKYFDIS
jgi:ribosomal protein S13